MAEEPETPQLDPNMPLDQLWGLTPHDVTAVMVYGVIGAALLGSLGFAVIAVFARRWKAGLWVLLAVLAFEALPLIVMGIRLEGTLREVVGSIIWTWGRSLPPFLLIFCALAWLARHMWDDLGLMLTDVVDRWGARGGVVAVAVMITALAAAMAFGPR